MSGRRSSSRSSRATGAARRGRLHARARRRRDAGVHARRHARRGQGRHGRRARGARRRDHPRQHLPPAPAAGRRSRSRARGGLHAFMGVDRGRSSPTRAAIRCSVSPARRTSERRRRRLSVASRRPRARAHARIGRRHPGAARIGRRDDVRRVSELARDARRRSTPPMARTLRWARRGRDGFSRSRPAQVAGRAASDAGPGAVRHHSGRHRTRTCATGASPAPLAVGFEAYAIGGLSVGEPVEVMYDIVGAHGRRSCRTTGPAT